MEANDDNVLLTEPTPEGDGYDEDDDIYYNPPIHIAQGTCNATLPVPDLLMALAAVPVEEDLNVELPERIGQFINRLFSHTCSLDSNYST